VNLFRRIRPTLPFVLVWTIFVVYVVAARGVRNFFPISAFDMYQARSPDIASRIMAIDLSGQTVEIERFDVFQCDPPQPALENNRHCSHAGVGRVDYVVRDKQIYLDGHLSNNLSGGEEVKLVWRTVVLEDRPGPPASSDCILANCRARRKAGVP
jgi:hypothetical protein